MSVVVSIEEAGPCRKRVTIEVPAEAVDAETRRVVGEFRKRTRVPGFRKGKVPEEIVRSRFSEDIEQEVVERLLPRYWRQAEAESDLSPLLPPRVEEVDVRDGETMTFVATVETRPEFGPVDMDEIELPELEAEPTDDEVAEALESIRRDASPWVDAGRPAADGDRVTAELTALAADGSAADQPRTIEFDIGDASVWEELSVQARGMSAGEEGELVRRGEGEEAPERRHRLAVSGVKEQQLIPLDDSLAAKVGKFEDLDALRAEVVARLRRSKEMERRQERERAFLDELRRRHPTDLPEGVVQQEVESLLREYAESLARGGVNLERAEIDWKELADKVKPQAERRVHARLLVDAVGEERKVEVSESEFEQALANIARAEGRTTIAVRKALDESDRLAELRTQLRREKVLRQVLGEEEAAEDPEAD